MVAAILVGFPHQQNLSLVSRTLHLFQVLTESPLDCSRCSGGYRTCRRSWHDRGNVQEREVDGATLGIEGGKPTVSIGSEDMKIGRNVLLRKRLRVLAVVLFSIAAVWVIAGIVLLIFGIRVALLMTFHVPILLAFAAVPIWMRNNPRDAPEDEAIKGKHG
ncbi:hypothetical protein KPL76_02950 [Subtercola sp. PAMC28395]|uniref:hypothetical protein n=1 Tax=Subtercola sp. PAMC28395 TaxID=2846775 RepID=UPI001C0D5BB3|nr:hypothetical protein [Subtercola sp. PAMC28395]QWT24380.1 hypothetical protein KPL76_02950 [Subtercola sp. PAMC28395]